MLVYYLLVLLPLIVALLQLSRKSLRITYNQKILTRSNGDLKRKNIAILLFFAFYLTLLMLRREDVGADTVGYIRHFQNSQWYSLSDYLKIRKNEQGFYALLRIIAYIFPNERFMLCVLAVAYVLPIAIFYYKHSENQLLSIALFLILPIFPLCFSGLRQSFAIALTVISYYFVKNKKPIPFVLIIFAATLFHQSAILALLLYPIYHIKLKRVMLWWIIPLLVFVYVNNARLYLIATSLLGSDYNDSYGSVKETGAYMMIVLFVLFLAYSYILVDEKEADEDMLGLRNILILITALQFFSMSNPIAMRVNYYFVVFLPIIMPKMLSATSKRFKLVSTIASFVMVAYFIYYFFRRAYFGEDILCTFPYYAFWQ